MKKKLLGVLVLTLTLLFFTGCADWKPIVTPVPNAEWKGSVVSKNFRVSRNQMIDDVVDKMNGISDEQLRTFIAGIVDKIIPSSHDQISYIDNSTCQDKLKYLREKSKTTLSKLPAAITYTLKNNTATGVSVRPCISNTLSTIKQGNGFFLQQFTSNMAWRPKNSKVRD